MRRLVALVLAQALVASPTMVLSLHVHDYTVHDHPDHHHGPASHEHAHPFHPEPDHDAPAPHKATPARLPRWGPRPGAPYTMRAVEDGQVEVGPESCDPGRHIVALKMGGAQGPDLHLGLAETVGPTIGTPTPLVRSAVGIIDVRVHGPPSRTDAPPRAPPLIVPA